MGGGEVYRGWGETSFCLWIPLPPLPPPPLPPPREVLCPRTPVPTLQPFVQDRIEYSSA
uniref:Uncharacterized protein n=1 Tax=Mustela putorius furo TaxID=9669 RepID=M3XZK5_MUSPF